MNDRLQELLSLYRKADAFADEAANLELEIALPARDELRLAARCLLNTVGRGDSTANRDELRQAEEHCEEAIREVLEAGIEFVESFVTEFKHTYRTLVISEVINAYSENLDKLRSAQRLVESERPTQTSVADYADQCRQAFLEIRDIVPNLDAHRDDLNTKAQNQRKQNQYRILAIVIALLALVVSVIGLLVTLGG